MKKPAATHHKHPVKHTKKAATLLAANSASSAAGTDLTARPSRTSSPSVPRIAIVATAAAGFLLLLAVIALGVSMFTARGKSDGHVEGGGNLIIR